ncbi:MAG TPA: acyltransferase [Xanthobacteraceae bacterium]|nr:acyltransferase [Xanthobacteraceae bacterium]
MLEINAPGLKAGRPLETERKLQLPALTGARGVAALAVLVAHGFPVLRFTDVPTFAACTVPLAMFAMSLFFVLSGFVIYLNYAALFGSRPFARALRSFAVARFARLYPLFAFVALVTFATIESTRWPGLLPDVPWFLALVQSWWPTTQNGILVLAIQELAHTWSISTEMFFYLCFPLMYLTLFRRPASPRGAALALFCCGLAAAVAMLFLYRFGARLAPRLPREDALYWLGYFSPYARIFEFAAGCFAARLFCALAAVPVSRREAAAAHALVIASLAGIIAVIWWAQSIYLQDETTFLRFIRLNVIMLPMITALLFAACRYRSWLSAALSRRSLIFVGEISYSIYMLHLFLMPQFYGRAAPLSAATLAEWLLRLAVYVALTIALAFGTYRLIEQPARRWIRRTFSGDRPETAPTRLIPDYS